MKKYSEFLASLNENQLEEASGKNFIDVFDEEKPFGEPVYRVHREDLIEELEGFLMRVENGTLERVTVFADLPVQGKNRPAYLSDILPEIEPKKKEVLDPEDNPWAEPEMDGDDLEDDSEMEGPDNERNVFVDVEFEVVGVDKEQNLVVGMPYSLRRKKITTPIHPKYVQEIYYKKAPKRSAY